MTSERAQWAVQTAFDGGIQQQPEIATKNSVQDALNVWTPFSRADRRPGYSSLPGARAGISIVTGNWFVYDPSGTLISSGGNTFPWTFPAVSAGSTFVVSLTSLIPSISGESIGGILFSGASLPAFALSVMGVQTARGFVILDTPYLGSGVRVFALPPDVVLNASGLVDLTFCLTVSVPSTPGVNFDDVLYNSSPPKISYTQRIEYNSGTKYLYFADGDFIQSTSLILSGANVPLKGFPAKAEFPPQIAVVPELDKAYFVLGGGTAVANFSGTIASATTQDGTVIGVPPTQMACYGTFPGGSQIINFRGHLFANGSAINGQQNILFWNYGNLSETSSGEIVDTTNIWPVTAFAALSDARDNSEITALFPVGDNLGVAKKNSIWLAPLVQAATPGAISGGVVTQNAVLVDQFAVQLVVPGVGCLAPGSVQAIPGGILLLAEDAFYLFDGTPNIRPKSYNIQDYVNRITPGRKSYAQAVNWRTQRMYLCAVSLDDNSSTNDTVFVYDYQSDAWWVFQGRDQSLDIVNWLILDGVGFREELWFQDSSGNLNKFIGDTDYGIPIDSYIVTQRFGEFDLQGRDVTEIRTQSINNQQTIVQPSVQLWMDDIPVSTQHETDPGATTKPITYPLSGEVLWSQPPVSGTSAYAPTRRRERKTPITGSGYWFQAKIMNLMQYIGVMFGYNPNGRR